MLDNNLKRHLKLAMLVLALVALLGPYLGLHIVSASARRESLDAEVDQPLPLHNPIPIPPGLKAAGRDAAAPLDAAPGKLSEIEDLLGSSASDKQQPGNQNGQN